MLQGFTVLLTVTPTGRRGSFEVTATVGTEKRLLHSKLEGQGWPDEEKVAHNVEYLLAKVTSPPSTSAAAKSSSPS